MVGVLLISLGYNAGRQGHSGQVSFWCGSIVVVLLVTPQIIASRLVTKNEALGVATLIAVATYLIKFDYSPLALVFGDEYQHLATAIALQDTGHLFTPNNGLPISPYYPGLELANSAISYVTRLSIVDSAYVLTAVLHLLTTIGLFGLYHSLTRRPLHSLIAVLVYTTGGDYLFFNNYFAYETIGLAFTILALWAFQQSFVFASHRTPWLCLTGFFGAVVVISHHASSYLLLFMALGLALAHCLTDKHNLKPSALVLLPLAALTVIWDGAVSRVTSNYIQTALRQLLAPGKPQKLSTGILPNTPTLARLQSPARQVAEPYHDLVVEYIWATVLLTLLAIGILMALQVLRSRPREPHSYFAIFSGVTVAAFGARIISPGGGGELGTRLLGFFLVPASLPIAAALVGTAIFVTRRRHLWLKTSVIAAGLGFLQVGGMISGWPPYFARIPGTVLAGGRMRSINEAELQMGAWAQSHLPTGSLIVADEASATVLSGYTNSVTVASPYVAPFFLDDPLPKHVLDEILMTHPDYVVVNLSLINARVVPEEDIFPGDPFVGRYPSHLNDAEGMDKFSHFRWLSDVFTDGEVEVFKVINNSPDAPVHP